MIAILNLIENKLMKSKKPELNPNEGQLNKICRTQQLAAMKELIFRREAII
jgi:hypothetical protein